MFYNISVKQAVTLYVIIIILNLYNLFCKLFLIQDVQQFTTVAELEEFIIEHGEQILDVLGSEVDRIEKEIKVKILVTYLLCIFRIMVSIYSKTYSSRHAY